MKKLWILFIAIILVCGCGNTNSDIQITATTVVDYEDIMENNEVVIIDVRTKEEYDEGHLVDAINIPYDEIDYTLDISKDKIIFVYCKSGGRSSIAYETLINMGYNVYNLGAYENIDLPKE